MSWAGLASNQCVSCNNLQDAVNTSVFVLKNSIPVSTKQITKAEAENYVYINTIPSKTSNQLVVKSNLTAASLLPYSYTIFYSIRDGDAIEGFNTSGEACAASTYSDTVYSSSSTIGVGTALYFDAYGTEPVIATIIQYYRIGSNYITFETLPPPYVSGGNVINSIGTCVISYTISWSLTDVTTGYATLEIVKNGSAIVIQSGDGSGSFSVTSSDVISYNLSATSPNFTYAEINDSVYGAITDCNFNSAFVNNFPGNSYTSNASINGVAIDYVDGCP